MNNSLKQAFRDKDYRHGYVDEFLNASIATQIKVLREQREWNQKELADRAEMMQPRISVMENVNYSSWSIKILRKLAEAFDLTLCVYFESFGKRVGDIEEFSRGKLERYSFEDDPYFKEKSKEASSAQLLTASQQEPYSQVVEQTHSLGITATAPATIPAKTAATLTRPSEKASNLLNLFTNVPGLESSGSEKDTPKTIADYYRDNLPTKVGETGVMSAIGGL